MMKNERGPTKSALLFREFPDGQIIEMGRAGTDYTVFRIMQTGRRHMLMKLVMKDGEWRNVPSTFGGIDLPNTQKEFIMECVAFADIHSVLAS